MLSGSNTYSGGTTISQGTLQLGDGSANNGSVSGNITDNATLVFANPDAQTYGGVISGSGALTKTGAGTLILSAANSYGGGTTISQGTLQLGDGSANNGSVLGNITDNATLAFANPIAQTYSNVISGNGALTKSGPGTLILSGANSYGGATTISQGVLQIGNGGASGQLGAGPVTDGAALVFDRSGATTVSNAISGAGAVTLAAGTLTLSGANSYGATTVNAGQLIIGNTLTNSGALTVAGGAVFQSNYTFSAASEYIGYSTSGAGAYAQSGGTNAVSGIEQIGYSVSGGTYTLSGSGVNSVGGLKFGNNQPNDVSATYNLNGGTLAVGSSGITYGTQSTSPTPTWSFNLGGGTLQATGNFTVANTNTWLVMALPAAPPARSTRKRTR